MTKNKQTSNIEVITNGGSPVGDCPTDWDKADKWADLANSEKEKHSEPVWSWDCGFKLDFDGPLLRISSRFYPPKTHQGFNWDGSATLYFCDDQLDEKKFEAESLDDLKNQVEGWYKHYSQLIISKVKQGISNDSQEVT